MKRVFGLFLACLLAFSLVACGADKQNEASSNGVKDVLTVAVMADCGDMNPHGLTSNKNWKIKGQCYETLFYVDYETGEIEPMLATDYEWVDNCTLKIKLREGVQFHNGYGEMTADDVLFSLNEVYHSAANYPIATLDMDKCEKVDNYTIILRTTEPYSPLVNNLSNCATAIFSKAGFEADKGNFSVDIGTGPFVFDEWLEGESVTQVRFDDYWAGAAKLSKIVWKVIDSDASRSLELMTGGCDLSYIVSMLDREKLEDKGFVFEKYWINDTNTLVFNCELDLFKDNTTLRRALAYAFDKTKVATVAHNDPERAMDLMLDYMHPYGYNEYPHQFSGGMKQRVVIAIALACNPKLLIADEPTTALDVTIQAQVLDLMKELKKKFNTSIILITHDFGIVAELCEKVAVMYAGEIVESGRIDQIFTHKSHPYTVGLFGAIPSIDEDVERLETIPGMPANPADLPTGCKFHPRCRHCAEICRKQEPPEIFIEDGHMVRCHLFAKQEAE